MKRSAQFVTVHQAVRPWLWPPEGKSAMGIQVGTAIVQTPALTKLARVYRESLEALPGRVLRWLLGGVFAIPLRRAEQAFMGEAQRLASAASVEELERELASLHDRRSRIWVRVLPGAMLAVARLKRPPFDPANVAELQAGYEQLDEALAQLKDEETAEHLSMAAYSALVVYRMVVRKEVAVEELLKPYEARGMVVAGIPLLACILACEEGKHEISRYLAQRALERMDELVTRAGDLAG